MIERHKKKNLDKTKPALTQDNTFWQIDSGLMLIKNTRKTRALFHEMTEDIIANQYSGYREPKVFQDKLASIMVDPRANKEHYKLVQYLTCSALFYDVERCFAVHFRGVQKYAETENENIAQDVHHLSNVYTQYASAKSRKIAKKLRQQETIHQLKIQQDHSILTKNRKKN
mmetsp:Transcript_19119/g.28448  ORF Transcript_19119/g.28448 Transcript_19119/m.28448 type:complete len:171 (+) Transcript_19119:583-1095(+)